MSPRRCRLVEQLLQLDVGHRGDQPDAPPDRPRPGRASHRVDRDRVEQAQVDHQAVVADGDARGAVRAPAHRYLQLVLAREADRRGHVGRRGAPGHIGGNVARRAALAGYDVTVSFARDPANLAALAQAGSLAGRVVVDTTNQFGRGVAASPNGHTAVRRPGAVYGEEHRKADAEAVVAAVRAGRTIPPAPSTDR